MKTMKIATKWIMVLALATCFASTNAMAQTRDAKSSQSLEYELALQRGTQAVMPYVQCRCTAILAWLWRRQSSRALTARNRPCRGIESHVAKVRRGN